MKKIALFSLSLLILASAVQPAFGMQGNGQGQEDVRVELNLNVVGDIVPQPNNNLPNEQHDRQYRTARKDAKWAGVKTGFYAGIFSGLGLAAYLNPEKSHASVGLGTLIGSHLLSNIVWKNSKQSLNEDVKANRNFDQNKRKAIRKNFHRHVFLSNVATTAAVITTIDACINNDHTKAAIPALSLFTKFSSILLGTYVWKSYTYWMTRR